jgi:hypothetical protein
VPAPSRRARGSTRAANSDRLAKTASTPSLHPGHRGQVRGGLRGEARGFRVAGACRGGDGAVGARGQELARGVAGQHVLQDPAVAGVGQGA